MANINSLQQDTFQEDWGQDTYGCPPTMEQPLLKSQLRRVLCFGVEYVAAGVDNMSRLLLTVV
jgi:hypothetical protein